MTTLHALDLREPPRRELDDDHQAYFKKCEEKLGMVPHVLRAYAWNQRKLRVFAAYYNEMMLGDSGLSKLEREMIAVVVSSINRCYYCLVAHGAAVRQLSGDPALGEQLVMNYRAAPLSPRQRAMLDAAARLTSDPAAFGEPDRGKLRAVGFGDADIWDICDVTGLFNMTNRVAAGIEMAPNPEYHTMAR